MRFGDVLAWVAAPSETAAVRRSLDLHPLGDWTDDTRQLVACAQDAYPENSGPHDYTRAVLNAVTAPRRRRRARTPRAPPCAPLPRGRPRPRSPPHRLCRDLARSHRRARTPVRPLRQEARISKGAVITGLRGRSADEPEGGAGERSADAHPLYPEILELVDGHRGSGETHDHVGRAPISVTNRPIVSASAIPGT